MDLPLEFHVDGGRRARAADVSREAPRAGSRCEWTWSAVENAADSSDVRCRMRRIPHGRANPRTPLGTVDIPTCPRCRRFLVEGATVPPCEACESPGDRTRTHAAHHRLPPNCS